MTEQEKLSQVPAYDSIVDRNKIEILQKSGDLVLRNGDIAMTRWGDFMLVSEDYSAFVKLVEAWRFNLPTLKVLFESSIESTHHLKDLEGDLESIFSRHTSPTGDIDYDAYHRTNDAMGAKEVACGVYAGSIAIVLSNMLQSFRANIVATQDEWKKATPLFFGCSVGQILVASANNVRHADEWQTTRPLKPEQMKSIQVLSAALQEPLVPPDGSRHRFSREVSPETLHLISDGDFGRLEANLFNFANDLFKQRQTRLPTQVPTP
jgi:hypothetical protein